MIEVPAAVGKLVHFLAGLGIICLGLIALLMCAAVVAICVRYIIEMRRPDNGEEPDTETEGWSEADIGEPETEVPGQTSSEEKDPEAVNEE